VQFSIFKIPKPGSNQTSPKMTKSFPRI